MTKTDIVKKQCKQLKLATVSANLENIIAEAEKNKITYLDLVKNLMEKEISNRSEKDKQKRVRLAHLPMSYNLENYDFTFTNGIEKQQLNQLRELKWLEQNFNIILMGPSGIGKTFIAAGICFDALRQGYRAYFKTMDELVKMLKMKNITRNAMAEYQRILRCHLLVIDDIMMFPINQPEAIELFNLINELHEKASIVITTNKSPKQWADVLKDPILTTALLDRILYRCEIIKLEGNSYRMKNRKNIFNTNLKKC